MLVISHCFLDSSDSLATVQQRPMFWAAGIVDAQFAEYLSSLTDVPSTLETAERDSAGKVIP